MTRYFLFVLSFFITGCAIKQPLHVKSLETLLLPIVKERKEASKLAQDAKEYALDLKKQYELTDYANWNNFLINIGVKKRGLCWQLAVDMLMHLKSKNYNVDYYIGVANLGEYFSEHNVLVLTCKGCAFERGVLLDPWRKGGELFYSNVLKDEKFSWTKRGDKR